MKRICGLLVVMGCAWLIVMYLDWSRLWTGVYSEAILSKQIKLGLSSAAFMLVLLQYKVKLSPKDHWLLGMVFFLFFSAEIAFYKNIPHIGIGIFALAHIAMIIRHLKNIKGYVRGGGLRKDIVKWIMAGAGILVVNVLALVTLFGSFTKNPLFPVLAGYSFFLCISVGAGIATTVLGYFPRRNARMIVVGIILFYLGDLAVGLNILFSESGKHLEYIISSSSTWMIYLPSITLIALSGINWEKAK